MGEYAKSRDGREFKIGTCESMYYLRADQVPELASSDVDGHWDAVRFRFPFPDEDGKAAGNLDTGAGFDPFRRFRIDGLTAAEVSPIDPSDHYSVQFQADRHGYLVSIPCPEVNGEPNPMGGTDSNGLRIHRNGFPGSVFLVQQRIWDGKLVAVFQCNCGAAWRVETLEDAEQYIVALRSAADHKQRQAEMHPSYRDGEIDYGAEYLHKLADRITAGYTNPPAWINTPKSVRGAFIDGQVAR